MYWVSFTPEGDWFIFDDRGKTIECGFHTRKFAELRAREMAAFIARF